MISTFSYKGHSRSFEMTPLIMSEVLILLFHCNYRVSQNILSLWCFLELFTQRLRILSKILHAYRMFISTPHHNIFVLLCLTVTKLCHTKCNHQWIFPFNNASSMNCYCYCLTDKWAPSSPYLNPRDYHVWGAMLQVFHKLHPKSKTIPELKSTPQQIWDDLRQSADNDQQSYSRLLRRPVVDTLNIMIWTS